jgi:hypothetical protein
MTSKSKNSVLLLISFSIHDVCVSFFIVFANVFVMTISRSRLIHTSCNLRYARNFLCAFNVVNLNLISFQSAKS